jgi:hypothetical protein
MRVSQVSQISDYMIADKKAELLAEYVNNDSYLDDALRYCFAEARAVYSATTLDDKLAAVDAFQARLSKVIKNNDLVNCEAWDFYKNQVARG